MRLIKPSYEIVKETGLALIERAGRCCWQSDPAGDPEGFVSRIIKRGHLSVIEHLWLAVPNVWAPSHLDRTYLLTWGNVVYGNARAWREFSQKKETPLPAVFADTYPVLFDDCLSAKGTTIKAFMPLPEPVFTVRIICDTGITHELVRHRHQMSFSQESSRYCCYIDHVTFIIPPWVEIEPLEVDGNCLLDGCASHTTETLIELMGKDDNARDWLQACAYAENSYQRLITNGWTAQQARDVLLKSLKTEIYTTTVFSQWRHIFSLRCAPAAHPQMREIMIPLQKEMLELVEASR